MSAIQKYYIWGWGRSAHGAARYLQSQQSQGKAKKLVAIISEKKDISDNSISVISPSEFIERVSSQNLATKNCSVIFSPGLPPSDPYYTQLRSLASREGIILQSAFELGLEDFRGRVIAVTGSNGKSSVVTMLEHVLLQNNIRAKALGNIGLSVCEYFAAEPKDSLDVIILELSSFQLFHYGWKLSNSLPQPQSTKFWDLACILNISCNHLDWHGDMPSYVQAKGYILQGLKKSALLWLDSSSRASLSELHANNAATSSERKVIEQARGIHTDLHELKITLTADRACHVICKKDPIQKTIITEPVVESVNDKTNTIHTQLGINDAEHSFYAHDASYVQLISEMAKEFNLSQFQVSFALLSYKKLAHRMEPVAIISEITFIDDSKATSLSAVSAALSAFSHSPIHLIVGGKSKSSDFSLWAELLKDTSVVRVYCIGECGEKIAYELEQQSACYLEVEHCFTLKASVLASYRCAKKGDCVILSPGCSSLDQFLNFEQRGECFKKIVLGLAPDCHTR